MDDLVVCDVRARTRYLRNGKVVRTRPYSRSGICADPQAAARRSTRRSLRTSSRSPARPHGPFGPLPVRFAGLPACDGSTLRRTSEGKRRRERRATAIRISMAVIAAITGAVKESFFSNWQVFQ